MAPAPPFLEPTYDPRSYSAFESASYSSTSASVGAFVGIDDGKQLGVGEFLAGDLGWFSLVLSSTH